MFIQIIMILIIIFLILYIIISNIINSKKNKSNYKSNKKNIVGHGYEKEKKKLETHKLFNITDFNNNYLCYDFLDNYFYFNESKNNDTIKFILCKNNNLVMLTNEIIYDIGFDNKFNLSKLDRNYNIKFDLIKCETDKITNLYYITTNNLYLNNDLIFYLDKVNDNYNEKDFLFHIIYND